MFKFLLLLAANIVVALELIALSPITFYIPSGFEVGSSPCDIQL